MTKPAKVCDARFDPPEQPADMPPLPSDACVLPASHDGPFHAGLSAVWGDEALPTVQPDR